MTPIHQQYCTTPTINTLDELFLLIDKLDPRDRDAICMITFDTVVAVHIVGPEHASFEVSAGLLPDVAVARLHERLRVTVYPWLVASF